MRAMQTTRKTYITVYGKEIHLKIRLKISSSKKPSVA